MSTATADFVVAGAGHNSLITAAYLARAGYEVVVLDARAIPGGGAASDSVKQRDTRDDQSLANARMAQNETC